MSLSASKLRNTNNTGQNLSLFAPNIIHFPLWGEGEKTKQVLNYLDRNRIILGGKTFFLKKSLQ